MANTIITKNSSTASAVPTSGDLVQGELAVNVTDKRLFTENSGGTVVELGTNPSQLNFADNAKAIFGTGGDLEIYHTGNNSFITDVGTGSLYFEGATSVNIRETVTGLPMAVFTGSGSTALYHSGIKKFETTSTGIDVTGTVVADGLTVEGNPVISGTSPQLFLQTGATHYNWQIAAQENVSAGFEISSGSADADATNDTYTKRLVVGQSGDISFYEDTGTTPKFFWDASAESLGIGTSSPAYKLDVSGSADVARFDTTSFGGVLFSRANLVGNGSTHYVLQFVNSDSTVAEIKTTNQTGGTTSTGTGYELRFSAAGTGYQTWFTNSTERLRLDSSGNLGLGVTPSGWGSSFYGSIELQSGGFYRYNTTQIGVSQNAYNNGTNWIYKTTDEASDYYQFGGKHVWRTAPSGTAGNAISFTQAMTLDASGRLGIGTSLPGVNLDIKGDTGSEASLRLYSFNSVANTYQNARLQFELQATASSTRDLDWVAKQEASGTGGAMCYEYEGSERLRIDSSGNLLVGTTDSDIPGDSTGSGVVLKASGRIDVTREGVLAYFNRTTSDGDIVEFRKNGAPVGSIGAQNSRLYITVSGGGGISLSGANLLPTNSSGTPNDNANDIGFSAYRWDDIYATNGTIQTSDRNEKQDIETLSEAEARVAVACKGLLRKFRWKDKVAEKGDEARIHFGIIAQDLQDAFAAEGLDAGRYAMFISSTWTDEETGEERTRLGVRYPELLAFIIAAI